MIPLNTPSVVSYVGNNTASVFSITYPTFEDADIEVEVVDSLDVVTPLVIDTDFTLSSIGIPNTNASLTLVDINQAWLSTSPNGKLATGYTLNIKFTTSASQPAKFRDLGRFSPETFEKTLDRLTMNMLAIRQGILDGQADVAAAIVALQAAVSALQANDTIQDTRLDDLEAAVLLLQVGSIANALIFG